jgi:signal transduction histidine kinase
MTATTAPTSGADGQTACGPPREHWSLRLVARWRERTRRRPLAVDIAVALGCFLAFTVPTLVGAGSAVGSLGALGSRLVVAAVGALAVLPLVGRRRWPVTALAACTVVVAAAALAGIRFTPFVSNAGPVLAIAAFTVADRRERPASLVAVFAAGVAADAAGAARLLISHTPDQDAIQLLIVNAAWILGDAARARRLHRVALEREELRARAERERLTRAEERLRLSRDVHDVVSHSLSMIAVRSGVARLVLADRPEEADPALAAIETASRSALEEVRQVLRDVRRDDRDDRDDGSGPAGPARHAASARLSDLPALVAGLRRDGLDVTAEFDDPRPGGAVPVPAPVVPAAVFPAPVGADPAVRDPIVGDPIVPDPVEQAAYRIAQEALTNVVKHSGGARAWLSVRRADDMVTVSVTDDGVGGEPPPDTPGLGLIGMRERAELLGGRFEAGPRHGGGFTVTASFPIADGRSRP